MSDKKTVILDLDTLIPEKRIIKLVGKEIDVSMIPSRVMLKVIKKLDVFAEMGENLSDDSFFEIADIAVEICKRSFPEITVEWLIDNTDIIQLIELLQFIVSPLRSKIEKNLQTAQLKQVALKAQK
jgi:hypothetical protein